MENINFSEDIVSSWGIRDQMEKHGFTKVATNIALKMLSEKEMVESRESENYSGDPYHGYALTNKGESWLIANQEKLQLKIDDIPF